MPFILMPVAGFIVGYAFGRNDPDGEILRENPHFIATFVIPMFWGLSRKM